MLTVRRRRLEAGVGAMLVTVLLGSSRPSAAQSAQSTAQPRSIFLGSVPTGPSSGTALPLSLKDTVDRALKYNLAKISLARAIGVAEQSALRYLGAK